MSTGVIEEKDSAVLTCWKDIALHMGKAVRTVQRWEMELGLPVRRPNNIHTKSAVVVYVRELDAWMANQWGERESKKPAEKVTLSTSEIIKEYRSLKSTHDALVTDHRKAMSDLIETCYAMRKSQSSRPPRERYLEAHLALQHSLSPLLD